MTDDGIFFDAGTRFTFDEKKYCVIWAFAWFDNLEYKNIVLMWFHLSVLSILLE